MPIRNSIPIRWSPKGLTDSADGTNSFQGAMRDLVNLIPDPTTAGQYVCRPAAQQKTDFTGTNAPTGPGVVSALLTVGDLEYGMISSSLNPGFDEPFCYDLANNAFLPVSGITAANVPATQPFTGDWVPPIMAAVAGRIVVTHPGFPGGTVKFGWFDVSGFSETTHGNTHTSTLIDGNPSILGVQPGDTIAGANIPANTSVVATAPFVLVTAATLTGSTLSLIDSTAGVAFGQEVTGLGIPDGSFVAQIVPVPFTTVGDTHSNTVLDNLDLSAGIPVFGNEVSGAGIPAGATVAAVNPVSVVTFAVLDGTTTVITYASSVNGVAIATGQFVSGFGIVAGTKVVSSTPFLLNTSGDLTAGSATVINLASTAGVVKGQAVAGAFIDPGTFVVSVDSPTQITMSRPAQVTAPGVYIGISGATVVLDTAASATADFVPITFGTLTVTMDRAATATASGVSITFTSISVNLNTQSLLPAAQRIEVTFSGGTITLSQAATGTTDNVVLTISGGTRAAPLWGAGDCDRNPLLSTPLAVSQMNGRAYFADGLDGIPFSDSGLPCRRSNQPFVQALTPSNGSAVTMVAPLELSSPITGGIVQATIAFQGDGSMLQISGDPESGNLAMNLLPIATGTLAPLSVVPCSLGTAFVSPQGLRFVRPDGSVTDPIGVDGQGVTHPFQFAVFPSRMCAEANVAVLRITVKSGAAPGEPFQEFWFDLSRRTWSGPHNFPARLIQHWRSTFIMAPLAANRSLWRSDTVGPALGAGTDADFIENGVHLSWISETVLLPDNAMMAMNVMVEANLTSQGNNHDVIRVDSLDEQRVSMGVVLLVVGPANQDLRERRLDWPEPIIFKQMSLRIDGQSNSSLRLGNHYMRYEILGYNNDDVEDTSDQLYLGDNTATIILTDDPQSILLTPS
jgi:hypothetical protein